MAGGPPPDDEDARPDGRTAFDATAVHGGETLRKHRTAHFTSPKHSLVAVSTQAGRQSVEENTMATAHVAAPERRLDAGPKLVVIDLASVFRDWLGPVPASEMLSRSVLIRTLAEARRDDDVYLIGCPAELARAAQETFSNSAVFIETDDPDEERDLSGQFLDLEKAGIFDELVIVSTDERFVEVAEMFKSHGRTVRVLTDRTSGSTVLNGEADVTVYFPSFDLI